jgi:asparagine synthase (glutamine-hydrolysing)
VLGCLSSAVARPDLTCVTFFSQTGGDDERAFARIAAEHYGASLVERPREATSIFDATLFELPKTPKPSVPFFFNRRHLLNINAVARARNADAVWTGQGGDHLFFHGGQTLLGAADFIAARGMHPGLFRAVRDAARVSREPYLSVLKTAWRLARSRAPWRPRQILERTPYFVDEQALPADLLAYAAHPWTEDAADLPKGKQFQIHYLAEVVNRHRPVPRFEYAYEHHPLLSQPLMTVCLQIPTYVLLQGGRQRGLARDAFADIVPREIIEREDKGSTTFYVTDAIRGSSAFIQELLLDGILVQQRILRRAALEPYLVQQQSMRPEHLFPLLACIAAEIWIRAWQGSAPAPYHRLENCTE